MSLNHLNPRPGLKMTVTLTYLQALSDLCEHACHLCLQADNVMLSSVYLIHHAVILIVPLFTAIFLLIF